MHKGIKMCFSVHKILRNDARAGGEAFKSKKIGFTQQHLTTTEAALGLTYHMTDTRETGIIP